MERTRHLAHACNETPQYVDLFGTGKRVLVMGFQPKGKNKAGNEGQMAWFAPGKDPTQPWEMHPISEPSTPPEMKDGKPVPKTGKSIPGTQQFSHGLGVGDINGDGRLDVICTGGWWEQPAKDDDKPWKFHPADLGDACADMYRLRPGRRRQGRRHQQLGPQLRHLVVPAEAGQGRRSGVRQAGSVQEPGFADARHALRRHQRRRPEGPGDRQALVVARPKGDADPASRPCSTGSRRRRAGRHDHLHAALIDDDSGIGTQFRVADVNGDKLLDIVISNKKGVFLFEQVRGK